MKNRTYKVPCDVEDPIFSFKEISMTNIPVQHRYAEDFEP